MRRYRIVYDKDNFPCVVWREKLADALDLAERFRLAGYSVDVWEHSDGCARFLPEHSDGIGKAN